MPAELENKWTAFWKEIKGLEQFTIGRWLATGREASIQIHEFSDASKMAYGAAVYVRVKQLGEKIESHLVVSKAKVAPLKNVTILRLELVAAELLSQLIVEVKTAMEWSNVSIVLWTDSMVTLHWIRKTPRDLKTFVANRVASIQASTDIGMWRHVGTRDNPADLLSHGVLPAGLVNNKLWLHEPSWLRKLEEKWPANVMSKEIPDNVA